MKITKSPRPFPVIFSDKCFQNEEKTLWKNALEDPQVIAVSIAVMAI